VVTVTTQYIVQSVRYSTQDWADAGVCETEIEAREILGTFERELAILGPFRLVRRTEEVLD
jgi:hypothetical protein